MLRQADRERPVLDRHIQLLAVALERHAVAVLHLARLGEVCGEPPAVPVQEIAVAHEPDDEVETFLDEEVEEPVPVPAPVVHVYAEPPARLGDLPYHVQHLVVLAREPILLHGPHRHVKRHDSPAHARCRGGEAQVVAEVVAHAAPAPVPHLREERHPAVLRVRLLDVGGVYRHDGVVVHICGSLRQHRVLHRGVQPLGEKMARQPLLRLLQQDVLPELAGDPAEDRRLARLYPEKHLSQELFLRFWDMGENYPHEFLKLFSQSVRGCAIIHGGFLSVVFVTPYYTGFTEGKPLPFPEVHISRQARNRVGFCQTWRMASGGTTCEFR